MAVAVYQVSLPNVANNLYSFSFNATISGNGWSFTFIFMNNHWTAYITPPSNVDPDLQMTREAAVYNGSINWLGYPDYGCLFMSAIPEPGLNDINSVSMYIYDWRT